MALILAQLLLGAHAPEPNQVVGGGGEEVELVVEQAEGRDLALGPLEPEALVVLDQDLRFGCLTGVGGLRALVGNQEGRVGQVGED